MVSTNEHAEGLLAGLGFTGLEAAVYRCLVENAPLTGYRVAQQIGKPIANTYKAIESLAAKGAVLIEEGEHRRCRAVPPQELLRRLERSFHERCLAAEAELTKLVQPADDDRVYPLRSAAQAYERAHAMIESARGVVLLDAFPAPARALREGLTAAAARGVRVACLVYEPIEIPGALIVRLDSFRWLARWPGDHFLVVCDALQHMIAVVEREGPGVVQALWSPSLILALTQYDGMVTQLIAHALDELLARGADIEQLRAERERFRPFSVVHAEGFAKLIGGAHEEPHEQSGSIAAGGAP